MKLFAACLLIICAALPALTTESPAKIRLEKKLVLNDASADEKFFFGFPRGGAVDAKGNIYIFDTSKKNKLVKLDPRGQLLWEYGVAGQGPGDLLRPQAVEIHAPANTVYLLDQNNRKVLLLSEEGKFLKEIKLTQSVDTPLRMAVDSKQNICIQFFSACNNRLLHRYAPDGAYLGGLIEPRFSDEKEPEGAMKNWTVFCFNQKDDIVLAYSMYNVIQIVRPDGSVIREWKQDLPYTPKPMKYIREKSGLEYWDCDIIAKDIAVDAQNRVYILSGTAGDEGGMRVDVYNNGGQWLQHFKTGLPPEEKEQEIAIGPLNRLTVMNLLNTPAVAVYQLISD